MATDQAAEALKQTALFANLAEEEREALVKTAREKTFEAGATIVQEGSAGVGFYLILQGRVAVRKGDQELARLGPGDYFGEMALLLEESRRTADVVALEETRCLLITRWDLRALIGNHPDISLKIHAELASRLNRTNQALRE